MQRVLIRTLYVVDEGLVLSPHAASDSQHNEALTYPAEVMETIKLVNDED